MASFKIEEKYNKWTKVEQQTIIKEVCTRLAIDGNRKKENE